VRQGGSLPEDDAVKMHVVDLLARDMDDLPEQDRRQEGDGGGPDAHAPHEGRRAPHHRRELAAEVPRRIIDPNVAYILFILGFYGLLFELSNPGAILPGIVGGICILLAFLAFQALPSTSRACS